MTIFHKSLDKGHTSSRIDYSTTVEPNGTRSALPRHFVRAKIKYNALMFLSKCLRSFAVGGVFQGKAKSLRDRQISGLILHYGKGLTEQTFNDKPGDAVFKRSLFKQLAQDVEDRAMANAIQASKQSFKEEQQRAEEKAAAQERHALNASLLSATQEELKRFAQTLWPQPRNHMQRLTLERAGVMANKSCLKERAVPTLKQLGALVESAYRQIHSSKDSLYESLDQLKASSKGQASDVLLALTAIYDAIETRYLREHHQGLQGIPLGDKFEFIDDQFTQYFQAMDTSQTRILQQVVVYNPVVRGLYSLLSGSRFTEKLDDFAVDDESRKLLIEHSFRYKHILEVLTTSMNNYLGNASPKQQEEGNPDLISAPHWEALCADLLARSGIDLSSLRKENNSAIQLAKDGQFQITQSDIENLLSEEQVMNAESQLSDQFHVDIHRANYQINGTELVGNAEERIEQYRNLFADKPELAQAVSRLSHQASLALPEVNIQGLIGAHGREGVTDYSIQTDTAQTSIQINYTARVKSRVDPNGELLMLNENLSFLMYHFTLTLEHGKEGDDLRLRPSSEVNYNVHLVAAG